MKYAYWVRIRVGRFLIILLAVALYICFVIVDGMLSLPYEFASHTSLWFPWMIFGFSAFVALMFLAVGVLVWLYASERGVARLLFGLSCSMMVVFAVQTGASSGISILVAFGDIAADLSLLLLAVLLFFFPKNLFSSSTVVRSKQSSDNSIRSRKSRPVYRFLLRYYIGILFILAAISMLYNGFYPILPAQIFPIFDILTYIYSMLALVSILITIIVSYRRISSLRERQQRRIFVGGVILTAAPLLLLTVIPTTFGFPSRFIVDPQLSTLTIGLFPLALGYSILRYQFLVFDMYIRRAVSWLVGVVGLIVGSYIVITLCSVVLPQHGTAYTIVVVIFMAMLAPFIWWLAKVITDHLFFNEMSHYQRLINRPDKVVNEKFDLNGAAQMLTLAIVNAFHTQEVCLFVLDEETGYFRLASPEGNDLPTDAQQQLLQRLTQTREADGQRDWIKRDNVIIERLTTTKRPLYLRETRLSKGELPTGLGRYLMSGDFVESGEPLLAPVKVQGKVIGVLALGERGDHQQYAGPDFEAIYLILGRFAPVIETARLYAEASRHVAILNSLYNASTLSVQSFETVHDVALRYTEIIASATAAVAQLLLYDKRDGLLHHVASTGAGVKLIEDTFLHIVRESDWLAWFYGGEREEVMQDSLSAMPSCLPERPDFPVAWIPLLKGDERTGILILTYPRPHIFSQEEKRVLSMFASQFSVVLENADITIQLRAAYERQKELDTLKDQFIMTASHELRTPLTAVQGYIELLNEYNESLSADIRADFIAKAHRSCDELTLMVSNIMDASRVQADIESTRLNTVSLAEAVRHILEILDATIRREKRNVEVEIPDEMFVMADAMRLRQIMLNICSNALKYSPAGSKIEIRATADDEWVIMRIQDYGSGVPPEFQEQVFERFVRLERDMNSPTRGAGLGLSICKQLVEAMGGRIRVESSGIAGEGSTFIFTLKRGAVATEVNAYRPIHQEV